MKFSMLMTLCLGWGLTAFGQNKDLDPDLYKIVRAMDSKMEEYIPAKNVDGIVGLYTKDAMYLPAAKGFFIGSEAIREEWVQTLKYDVVQFEMEIMSVQGSKELIYETGLGTSTIRMGEKQTEFQFKYLNVWEQQNDGGYKLKIDVYNQYKES